MQFAGYCVIRNPAGYCFVEFPSSEAAQKAMLQLNNKIIPGSAPVCDALHFTAYFLSNYIVLGLPVYWPVIIIVEVVNKGVSGLHINSEAVVVF